MSSPSGICTAQGTPTLGQIGTCTTNCHDPQGDSGQLDANVTGNVPRPVVGCEACHSGGQMHAEAGGAGPIGLAAYSAGVISGSTSSVKVSAQFATCTSCHELLDPNDPVNTAATATHDPVSLQTPTGIQYIITDTHFATPGNWTGTFDGATAQNKKNATGYAMTFSSEKVCTDCHNPHKTADINREWALSAHADPYSNNDEFPATQDPLGYFSGAWAHYNFGNAASYAICQRCHTTTGFSFYADTLRAGNTCSVPSTSSAALSRSFSTSPAASFKPEMLKCNGCHTDNKGTLAQSRGDHRELRFSYPHDHGAARLCIPRLSRCQGLERVHGVPHRTRERRDDQGTERSCAAVRGNDHVLQLRHPGVHQLPLPDRRRHGLHRDRLRVRRQIV